MMRRWVFPSVAGLAALFLAYQVTLALVPGVLMLLAIDRVSADGGVNRMAHVPLATDRSRAVVRPSPDLAYSVCPVDLSKGPVRIFARVPGKLTPYWSLSVFDAQTNTAFVRNNHQNGEQAIMVILAQPGQAVPAGAEVVRLSRPRAIALVRVLVPDRAAFAALDRARRASRCEALAPG